PSKQASSHAESQPQRPKQQQQQHWQSLPDRRLLTVRQRRRLVSSVRRLHQPLVLRQRVPAQRLANAQARMQTLAGLRARRCQFSERIGAAYCSEDDDVVADDHGEELLDCCGSSAFALPNMFVGRLFMGALPGSVFLQTWPTGGRNKTVPIPVYLIDSNNEVLTDVKELLAGYKKLLGRPLPDLAG
uniref:Sep15_SelM domain-containing protein n=1 Tax=Macrostomum lignano TaxID=282301 RepID=A0A1I8HHM3_9PLAT